MTDRNSPEEIAKRSAQEDPLVMYLIVRESLGMGMGKTAAQCAHASQMLQIEYSNLSEFLSGIVDSSYNHTSQKDEIEYNKRLPKCLRFEEWLNTSYRKVVLRADDKEWEKLKIEFKENMVLVIDAGLTQVPSGSETCIGLWPMYKSNVSKIVKKLQALK